MLNIARGRRLSTSNPGHHFGYRAEALEARTLLSGVVRVGSQPTGALTGKIVFVSPGHGFQYTSGAWRTDRGESNNMVEDFGNQDQGTAFADYLFRAGATVVPMRPIGHQTNEVVLDNDMAQVTYTGSWSNSTGSRYYDEDYGAVADPVHYRFASAAATESATATYTPSIPSAGFYPVYAWASAGANRTLQTYKINHTGGETDVKIDHSMVGNGWIYLGTYHFNAGSSSSLGSVVISNEAAAGKAVIADAIRFGNGMGDVPDGANGAGEAGGTISGRSREDENSLMWDIRSVGLGVDTTTFFSVTGTDPNVSAPARLAEEMYQNANTFGTGLYIAIHSNAGGGRGARGLITTETNPTPNQTALAGYIGAQINGDMQQLNGVFDADWVSSTSNTFTGAFGEINDDDFKNSSGVVEMDASLAEVAFHDNASDAAIMADPKGRDQIARSLYQAALQYFDSFGGLNAPLSLPTAPINVRAISGASGQVTVSWAAGPTTPSGVNNDAANGFRVYVSTDGLGFDGGTFVNGGGSTSTTLSGLNPNSPYYFRVVAVNSGGESEPTEAVSALPSGGVKQVLIVNGFDRFDGSQDFQYTANLVGSGTTVTVNRVWPRFNNSHDYVLQFESAIQATKPGVHVDSTSNEAVISGAVNLNNYHSVIWILGDESTVNDTFNATEQTKVTSFINAGGNLFLSGSNIAWDLDQQNNGRTFYETTLLGNYVADDAGTSSATADAAPGIFSGMSSFAFSAGTSFNSLDSQVHGVVDPDVVAPQSGAVSDLTFSGGAGTAGIQVTGAGGKGDIVMFGFPFEAMTSAARRQTAMGKILDFFGVTNTLSITPSMPNLASATNSGSTSDTITNFNNGSAPKALQFVVPGTIAGSTVTIYADGQPIGSTTVSGTTTTVTATVLNALAEGVHLITAEQFTPGTTGTSAKATNLSITVDTVAPTLNSNTFSYLTSQNLAFTFNENMATTIPATSLTLHNNTTSADMNSANFAAATSGGIVAFTFPGYGNVLPSGNYSATLGAASATDVAGNPLASSATTNFYFQAGDGNHNGVVTIEDFNVLATNFGLSGKNFSQGNYDYSADGVVNILDFNILATNFGVSVSTTPPAAPQTEPLSVMTASETDSPQTTRSGGRRTVIPSPSSRPAFSTTTVSDREDALAGIV
jgi:N-acetylmuramoyl-L-alanine amidase